VALLARRDFATQDLLARLTARGFDADTAAGVVTELLAEGILNEARFAQNFATWHAARGQGPLRIAAQLKQQGVAPDLIEGALAGPHDWAALASKVRRARFGPQPPRGRRGRRAFCSTGASRWTRSVPPPAPPSRPTEVRPPPRYAIYSAC
jgi:regulatory protein